MLLILGDSGTNVKVLQGRLTKAGYKVVENGQFDQQTEEAVINFQRANNLVDDGIVGNKTNSALLKEDHGRWLSKSDLARAAADLDVDLASVYAIKAVESKGMGFLDDGRPKILYERHVMRRQLQKNGVGKIAVQTAMNNLPDLVNNKPGCYQGGSRAH
jgi:hypothetical protein